MAVPCLFVIHKKEIDLFVRCLPHVNSGAGHEGRFG